MARNPGIGEEYGKLKWRFEVESFGVSGGPHCEERDEALTKYVIRPFPVSSAFFEGGEGRGVDAGMRKGVGKMCGGQSVGWGEAEGNQLISVL